MSNDKGSAKRLARYAALPFTTFGEITALGFEAHVYCIGCEHWGHCAPSWEIRDVRLDQPPWSAGVSFKCPGCRRPVMMASRIFGEGPQPSMGHLRVSAKD